MSQVVSVVAVGVEEPQQVEPFQARVILVVVPLKVVRMQVDQRMLVVFLMILNSRVLTLI